MRFVSISSMVFALGLAAGCSQPEPEPVIITPEPVYDKYGNEIGGGGCAQTPGAAGCDPDDDQRRYGQPGNGGGGSQNGGGRGGQGTPGAAGQP